MDQTSYENLSAHDLGKRAQTKLGELDNCIQNLSAGARVSEEDLQALLRAKEELGDLGQEITDRTDQKKQWECQRAAAFEELQRVAGFASEVLSSGDQMGLTDDIEAASGPDDFDESLLGDINNWAEETLGVLKWFMEVAEKYSCFCGEDGDELGEERA